MAEADRAEPPKVEAYLKAQKAAASRPLRLAIAAGFGVGLLVIGQAVLVASVISAVLFDKATLADVWPTLLLLPLVFLMRAALIYLGEQAAFEAAAAVKRKLRSELVDHLLALGPVRLSGLPTGTLVAAVTDSIEAIEPYYARYLPAASITALVPLAILVVVVPSDWVSALVFVVTAPLIPLFMVLIGRGAEKMSQRQWGGLLRMSGHLLDAIQGLPTLKLFNASRREAKAVSAMAESYRRDTMEVLRVAFLSSLALEFFATVSIAMVAVFIGFRLLWGEMAFFNGFLVLLLAPEFYAPLRALGAHYHARMEAIGAAEKIVELMAMTAPAVNRGGGQPRRAGNGPPHITFEDVSVTFDDGRRGLDGLSFDIAPGERIALVGPSGAGKSTVVNLLLGFLAPTSGRILIDGVPLAEIDLTSWRSAIAWLPQSPHLFQASVLDNIAMLEPPHDAQVRNRAAEAAREAEAADLIADLPQGLDTLIGEGGARLSGGQIQRIALARAMFRRPSLVLLDEPTSHLDRATETAILAATERLVRGRRTALIIAHRLETIRSADRILVLADGRLAETGTHVALMHADGTNARMAGGAASLMTAGLNP